MKWWQGSLVEGAQLWHKECYPKKGGWSGGADVIIFYLGPARLSCSGNINSGTD